ncbi:MAG: hypothetical protein QQN63_06680 [Nitrosopumilus sp.]
MSFGKKKTVLRSIRISQELDELLQKDAKNKRISVNALISTMMIKYAEWDRFADKFGYVTLTSETFKTILEITDEKKLSELAKVMGARLPKEVMLFWFKKTDLEAFLSYIDLYGKYSGLFQYELDKEGDRYTITAHHELGENWSTFLKIFIGEAMKDTLGIIPEFEVSKSSIVARFSERPSVEG